MDSRILQKQIEIDEKLDKLAEGLGTFLDVFFDDSAGKADAGGIATLKAIKAQTDKIA
jgi:hypothetical protein